MERNRIATERDTQFFGHAEVCWTRMDLATASLASAAAELMNRGTSPFPLMDSSSFCFTVGPL